MYPHFLDFKNREKASENHKAELRNKLRKTKESYIGYGDNQSKVEYDFPKMTEKELEEFRIKLQNKRKRENIQTLLIFIIFIIVGIIIVKYGAKLITNYFE